MVEGHAPAFSPGIIEQGLYTWSSSNLNGRKGRGFGAASRGLQRHVKWLGEIDQTHFRLLDVEIAHSSEAHSRWQCHCSVGSFHVDNTSVVYRKVAGAEPDKENRTRWIVHTLMGRSQDLDLASIGDLDGVWLSASDCPLDRIPRLSPLDSRTLVPRQAKHGCAEFDSCARKLLDRLVSDKECIIGRDDAVVSERVSAALLVSIPTALWPCIEIDWFVGNKGPVALVRVNEGQQAASAAGPSARIGASGLASCQLHAEVDRVWSELPQRQRSWGRFGEAYREHRAHCAGPPSLRASGQRSAHESPSGSSASQRMQLLVQTAVGAGWLWDRRLTAAESTAVLRALTGHGLLARTSLSELRPDELWLLLGNAVDDDAFNATATLFADVPTADLARAWRATCLAALGLSLLGREDRCGLEGRWALPKTIDLEQLERLVGPLSRRGGAGSDQVVELIRGGFGSKPGARHALVEALLRGGFTPQRVFGTILMRATLSPSDLLGFMRANPRAAATGLGLPHPYVEALVLGISRRRKPTLSSLLPRVRGGGAS